MSQFPIHTIESAPEASKTLLTGLEQQVGLVPNLAATMSESPALLEAFLGARAAASHGTLDAAARELVAIAVAVETGCNYCVAAHSTFAAKAGAEPAAIQAVRAGAAPADARLAALAAFARAVVRRQEVPARGQELVKAGLTPAQVLEVLAAIAVPMLASSVFHLTGTRLDAVFEPQAWTRPA